ncbi:Chloroperoxidase [Elsinoe ampelina]|uniref:Chloroperoxidase n=1 Tax=Elsinoe ampelina TaxID=302913 RepID=A0A6A6GNB5_9PEZI|nr:Chloroperoxidase [Elsinoe ampelina]
MKLYYPALVSTAWAMAISRNTDDWHPPGPYDARGPCPMLNALANHGILPRDGLNLTKHNTVKALTSALNFDVAFAETLWAGGVASNPEPNADYFTMLHLRRHNVIEHDASLSRQDAYFGNNFDFNETIFEGSKAFWVTDVIDRQQMANSRLYRQVLSKAYNPTYLFDSKTEGLSLGEGASAFLAFGDLDNITVRKDWTEYLFREFHVTYSKCHSDSIPGNERLPYSLGWTKRESQANLTDFNRMRAEIAKSANLMTGQPKKVSAPGMVVQDNNPPALQTMSFAGSDGL